MDQEHSVLDHPKESLSHSGCVTCSQVHYDQELRQAGDQPTVPVLEWRYEQYTGRITRLLPNNFLCRLLCFASHLGVKMREPTLQAFYIYIFRLLLLYSSMFSIMLSTAIPFLW